MTNSPTSPALAKDLLASHHTAFGDCADSLGIFCLSPHKPSPIRVHCIISHSSYRKFFLSFFVQGKILPRFDTPKPCDFLWQDTCFECFFAQKTGYVEINASPTGGYACYAFDSYRTPNTIPPVWADEVRFCWVDTPAYLDDCTALHFDVELPHPCHKIHPTAIIMDNKKPTFYATDHANPPDFHRQIHWHTLIGKYTGIRWRF